MSELAYPSIPRELTQGPDGMVLANPVRELVNYRGASQKATSKLNVQDAPATFDLEVTNIAQSLSITLAGELVLSWSKDSGWLEMAFANTGKTSVGAGRTSRKEPMATLESLRIVGDASSVEVFVNGGELSLSTLYYPEYYAVAVEAKGADITLWNLEV